jgi:hypothetical protein
MAHFMVVSTFKPGTNMQEVFTVVEEEKVKVKQLQDEGKLGPVRIASPQGKVFLEVYGESEAEAATTVESLPMAKWWTLEVYTVAATA